MDRTPPPPGGPPVAAWDETGALVRRAQELADRDEAAVEVAGLPPAELAAVARDLDVPVEALAGALAERYARRRTGNGVVDRLIGPAEIAVLRASRVSAPVARARAERWLNEGHGLRTRVDRDGVIVASRRRDAVGLLRRGVRAANGRGGLGRLSTVRVAVAEIDEDAAVCVAADVSESRRRSLALGAVSAGAVGMSGWAGLAVAGVAVPVTLVAVPVAGGVGVLVARRRHRSRVRRIDEAVESTADGVSRGERPPTIVGRLTDRLSERIATDP